MGEAQMRTSGLEGSEGPRARSASSLHLTLSQEWDGASSVAQLVKNLPATPETTQCCYSGLENPMDRGAWRAIPQRVSKSQT